jgi:hypothetical protein
LEVTEPLYPALGSSKWDSGRAGECEQVSSHPSSILTGRRLVCAADGIASQLFSSASKRDAVGLLRVSVVAKSGCLEAENAMYIE